MFYIYYVICFKNNDSFLKCTIYKSHFIVKWRSLPLTSKFHTELLQSFNQSLNNTKSPL